MARFIQIESQDHIAEKDPARDNGVLVKEAKPLKIEAIDEYVEIGRELCLPVEPGVQLPPYDLCAVMGKDLECEGEGGIARYVWCTTRAANSEVFLSLNQEDLELPLDEEFKVVEGEDFTYCHDFQEETSAIDATYFFRVRSTTEDGQVLVSDIYQFCTGGTITLTFGNFQMIPAILPLGLGRVPVTADEFETLVDQGVNESLATVSVDGEVSGLSLGLIQANMDSFEILWDFSVT